MNLPIRLTLAITLMFPLFASAGDKKERDKLQGTWKPVSYEVLGETLKGDKVKELVTEIVVRGDAFEWKIAGNDHGGSIKLDAARKPKHLDFVAEPAAGVKFTTWTGIYEVDGDTLKLGLAAGAGSRPKDFSTKGVSTVVLILKRSK